MKVLFTMTNAFNPNAGGVQRTTYKLGKHFTENGYDVFYYSTANNGHVTSNYGQLYHANNVGGVNNQQNINQLCQILIKINPNIVINQMPYEKKLRKTLFEYKTKLNYSLLGCLRNSLFSFKSNVNFIMKETFPNFLYQILNNNFGEFVVQKWHFLKHRKELRAIIDTHDRFILLAPPNKEELDFFVGDYKSEKVISIPNSIPAIHKDTITKEKIILHVGRLDLNQKRSDLLIKFWQEVCEDLIDWKFIIVGDGPYKSMLKKEIKDSKLPNIHLEGFQAPEKYYQAASIFMMPSAYEGFPNTILEAQSYGCIPFAFDSYGALRWIVNDGKDAFLIEPFNTGGMAKRLVSLIKNDCIEEIRNSSFQNAEKFTVDKVGEHWFKLFKELI